MQRKIILRIYCKGKLYYEYIVMQRKIILRIYCNAKENTSQNKLQKHNNKTRIKKDNGNKIKEYKKIKL